MTRKPSSKRPEKPSRNLSVVMVIQNFYPSIGGAEKQCMELSKGLSKRGIRVKVLTERWQGMLPYEEIEGIQIRRLGRGGHKIWHSLAFMMDVLIYLFIRDRDYSVVHAHLAASHAVAAAIAGKILRKKVVVLVGGGTKVGELALSRRTFSGRLKLRALGFLRPQLIILSQAQKQELRGFGLEKVPALLIPNGVDLSHYRQASPEDKAALRMKLGWKGLIFLYTGRFSPDKIPISIFENFLKGWKAATGNESSARFFLVGQGPLEADYQSLIRKYDLQASVELWPAREDVNELYQAADVFVLPSASEGLSNSLLEAMASNLPVLASRVPGVIDVVGNDIHGFLFDPTSPQEIENRLTAIFNNPSRLIQMGNNGWMSAVEYSMGATVDQYIDLYRSSDR